MKEKLSKYLMDHGVLKNADADTMAREIDGMFEKERDELRAVIDKANSVGYGTAFTLQIERIQKQRDELAAKCAEMRNSLERITKRSWFQNYMQHEHKHVQHALSTQCGEGWLSPESFDQLLKQHKATWMMEAEGVFRSIRDEEGWLAPEKAQRLRAMLQEVYEWCVTDNPSDIDGDEVKKVLEETR